MRWLSVLFILALGQEAQAEAPAVVTDIAPVHSIVARIMDGVAEPAVLLPQGSAPHEYAMRPSEARALARADLVVWVGGALTSWLEGPLETLGQEAQSLVLLDVEGTVLLPLRDGATFEADDHDHDHDHQGEHAEGESIDPHAWLDGRNAALWGGAIAEKLAALDPENAPVYRENAIAFRDEIGRIEQFLVLRLAPAHDIPFVVLHDAFHYFEARYGAEAIAAISAGDGSAPGPARLRAVRDMLAGSGVRCAFAEPQSATTMLETATAGQDISIVTLDPMGDVTLPLRERYVQSLWGMGNAMAECLLPK